MCILLHCRQRDSVGIQALKTGNLQCTTQSESLRGCCMIGATCKIEDAGSIAGDYLQPPSCVPGPSSVHQHAIQGSLWSLTNMLGKRQALTSHTIVSLSNDYPGIQDASTNTMVDVHPKLGVDVTWCASAKEPSCVMAAVDTGPWLSGNNKNGWMARYECSSSPNRLIDQQRYQISYKGKGSSTRSMSSLLVYSSSTDETSVRIQLFKQGKMSKKSRRRNGMLDSINSFSAVEDEGKSNPRPLLSNGSSITIPQIEIVCKAQPWSIDTASYTQKLKRNEVQIRHTVSTKSTKISLQRLLSNPEAQSNGSHVSCQYTCIGPLHEMSSLNVSLKRTENGMERDQKEKSMTWSIGWKPSQGSVTVSCKHRVSRGTQFSLNASKGRSTISCSGSVRMTL